MTFFVAGMLMLAVIVAVLYWLAYTPAKDIRGGLVLIFAVLLLLVAVLAILAGRYVVSVPSLMAAWVAFQRYRMIKGLWTGFQRFKQSKANETGAKSSGARGPMSREEACEILGVPLDASEDDIVKAHRRLMQKVHPDHGGSDYLASQINAAKDVLLK